MMLQFRMCTFINVTVRKKRSVRDVETGHVAMYIKQHKPPK